MKLNLGAVESPTAGKISLPYNWTPRHYQLPTWADMRGGIKRGAAICHRRWGKDEIALHLEGVYAMTEPATYWHMLPKASQARKAIWQAVNPHTGKRRIDEAFPKQIRRRTNDNEMFIEFVNGSFWHVVGSDNYDMLVGAPPKGIVFSEWSLANPAAWAHMEPILQENGGWALFIYTSRGRNHGWRMKKLAEKSDKWHYVNQTVADTNVFSEEQLADSLEQNIELYGEELGTLLFNQEYYNSFEGGSIGAYYAAELSKAEAAGRITSVPYEPGVPVTVYFDLGNAPNICMWFAQCVGLEHRVIDFEQPMITGVEEIARILQAKQYLYNELVLPHDGGHKQMGDLEGRTYQDILEQAVTIPVRVLERDALLPGIQATYAMIRKCWIDSKNCEKGLEAMYSYKREWDEKKGKLGDFPVHDWASHPSDGFRYLSIDLKPSTISGVRPRVVTDYRGR